MAKRKITDKQKDKMKNSEFARSNSSDLTINPRFRDKISYDDDGAISYDKRTREGKEIDRILNSRNRSSKKNEDDGDEFKFDIGGGGFDNNNFDNHFGLDIFDDDDDDDWDSDDEDYDDDSNSDDDDSNDDEDEFTDEERENYLAELKEELQNAGHTDAYIQKALELGYDEPSEIYDKISNEDAEADIFSQVDELGVSEQTKNFFLENKDSCLNLYEPSFLNNVKTFDEAFQSGMTHYGDEASALQYAEACYNGGEIIDIDDEFEDFVRSYEPLLLERNPFKGFETEEYDADTLISMYYDYGHRCLSYDDDGCGFSFDTDNYRSKGIDDDYEGQDDEE